PRRPRREHSRRLDRESPPDVTGLDAPRFQLLTVATVARREPLAAVPAGERLDTCFLAGDADPEGGRVPVRVEIERWRILPSVKTNPGTRRSHCRNAPMENVPGT